MAEIISVGSGRIELRFKGGKPSNVQKSIANMIVDVAIALLEIQQIKKRTASGRSLEMGVIVSKTSAVLLTVDYYQFVLRGRGAGKMPPVDDILEWVAIKIGGRKTDQESIAWAIAKTIAEKGVEEIIANDGLNTIMEVAIEKNLNEDLDLMAEELLDDLLEPFQRNKNWKVK